jgi:hypothetical protein
MTVLVGRQTVSQFTEILHRVKNAGLLAKKPSFYVGRFYWRLGNSALGMDLSGFSSCWPIGCYGSAVRLYCA